MVVSFSMAYRSFRGGSGRLDTPLDTPPSINRRHQDSCLAPRSEPVGTALAPGSGLPRLLRQAEGEGLDRKRLVLSTLQPRLLSSATRFRLRRHGRLTWRPHRGVGTDPATQRKPRE